MGLESSARSQNHDHLPAFEARLGFDLGGTKILAKIYDAEFNAVGRERNRTKGHRDVAPGLADHCPATR